MLLSQYAFTLPSDYPMRAIRDRIAGRGPQFDTLPDLGWKAFLLSEKGVAGATDHQYAPLYFWPSAQGLAKFLSGPWFAAVSDAFGRPRVATSLLVRSQLDAATRRPLWCTSEHHTLAGLTALHAHIAAFDARPSAKRHSAWLGLDASRWTMSCHELWWGDQPPVVKQATLHEVAHFSQPA